MKLWLRMGDNAEYESFGGIDEVAERITEFTSPENNVLIFRELGLEIPGSGFERRNYISLYWGTSNATPSCNLSIEEKQELRRLLNIKGT